MDNKTKVVYVLNVSNYELDIQYSAGVYSNIDLAMKKVFNNISNDMTSFNTLLSLSKIACTSYPTYPTDASHSDNSENKISTYPKEIVDAITAVFNIVVKNSLDDFDDEDIAEELFFKIQHLIPNPEQYNEQDLYEEFLGYIYHWTQLFKQYDVVCNKPENIHAKTKQMADGYQELHVIKEYQDFDHVNFTFEQLKQRYPNIYWDKYSFKHNEFNFSINDYWNMESKNDSYNIVRFVLDE